MKTQLSIPRPELSSLIAPPPPVQEFLKNKQFLRISPKLSKQLIAPPPLLTRAYWIFAKLITDESFTLCLVNTIPLQPVEVSVAEKRILSIEVPRAKTPPQTMSEQAGWTRILVPGEMVRMTPLDTVRGFISRIVSLQLSFCFIVSTSTVVVKALIEEILITISIIKLRINSFPSFKYRPRNFDC
jgi:hypothetical protein